MYSQRSSRTWVARTRSQSPPRMNTPNRPCGLADKLEEPASGWQVGRKRRPICHDVDPQSIVPHTCPHAVSPDLLPTNTPALVVAELGSVDGLSGELHVV